jgi:superfamily II DNA/RNA helicase
MVKRLKAKDANLGRRSKGSGKRGKPHKRRKPREPEPVDPDAAPVAPPPTEGPGRYDPLATTGGANPMAAAKCFTARGTTAAEAARDGPIPYLEQHQLTIEGGGQAEAGPLVPIQKFADAPFRRPLRALLSSRYQTPTPIQAVAWPLLTAGHDLVAIAKTGSGKTCAYLLPIINGTAAGHGGEKLAASGGVQAVVLAPTRELTAQIADEARRFAEVAQPPVEVCCFTGGDGTKLAVQLHELRARPENTGSGGGAAARRVLCATPGRLSALLELAEKGAGGAASVVGAVRVLVLDEADRLLEMGFERQLHAIVSLLPPQTQRQTLFFSATWPAAVRAAAAKLTRAQALRLRLGRDDGAGAGGLRVNADVKQTIQVLEDEAQKTARLKLMLAPWAASARAKPAGSPTGMPRVLVFVNTKKLCTALGAVLAQEGVRVDALHSEREQVCG